MKNKEKTLFAIYKKTVHMGNERGEDIDEAIKKYIIASQFKCFLDDLEFVSQYSGKIAIKNIHYL